MGIYYSKQNNAKITVTKVDKPTKIQTVWGDAVIMPGNYIAEFENGTKVGIHTDDLNNLYTSKKPKPTKE